MDGRTRGVFTRGKLCCHCLLIETADELILVDTGFGLNDVRDPRSRLSGFFLALLSPDFREEMTAIRQIASLGFNPRDVRHIILTHLDFDHAGGIDDFPWARVHLMRPERDHAVAQKTWLDRQRFRPRQWTYQSQWVLHGGTRADGWMGFEGVAGGDGLPGEVLMVPLIGHTLGHAGVAIRTDDQWLLLAGDAYFYHREMDLQNPTCTPGLRFYQWMMEKDRESRLRNQQRLRELRATNAGVRILCSHDPHEFEALAGHAMGETPVEMVRLSQYAAAAERTSARPAP